MPTLYDELGLTRQATDEEIHSAYRKLARQFHPDRNPGFETQAKERFQRIQKAFDTLSNPSKRKKYDETLGPDQFSAGSLALLTPVPEIYVHGGLQKQTGHRASVIFLSAAAIIAFVVGGVVLLSQHRNSNPSQVQQVAAQEQAPPSRTTNHPPQQVPPSPSRITSKATKPGPTRRAPKNDGDFADQGGQKTGGTKAAAESQRTEFKHPRSEAENGRSSVVAVKMPVPNEAALISARKRITDQRIAELHLDDIPTVAESLSGSGLRNIRIFPDAQLSFRDQQEKARKMEVASKLHELAVETNDDPAAKFVLLQIAADLAAEAGRCEESRIMLDELGQRFDVDLLAMKQSAAKLAADHARSRSEHRDAAMNWLAILIEAVNADRYETANSCLNEAKREGESISDKLFQKLLDDSGVQLNEIKVAYEAAKAAKESLAKDPDQNDAAETWGKFLCLYKNDWGAGLPLWSKGADQAPTSVAKRDFQSPATSEAQTELGNAWQDAADKDRNDFPKRIMRSRAAMWYARAIPHLGGLTQAATESRMEEILDQNSPIQAGQQVKILDMVEPETHTVDGIWDRKKTDLICEQGPGRVLTPIAISTNASYELEVSFTRSQAGQIVSFPIANLSCVVSLQSQSSTRTGAEIKWQILGPGVGRDGFQAVPKLATNRRHKLKLAIECTPKQVANFRCELDRKSYIHEQVAIPDAGPEAGAHHTGLIFLYAGSSSQTPSGDDIFHEANLHLTSGSARVLNNLEKYKADLSQDTESVNVVLDNVPAEMRNVRIGLPSPQAAPKLFDVEVSQAVHIPFAFGTIKTGKVLVNKGSAR